MKQPALIAIVCWDSEVCIKAAGQAQRYYAWFSTCSTYSELRKFLRSNYSVYRGQFKVSYLERDLRLVCIGLDVRKQKIS
jgi:hypothetical protein